MNAAIAVNDKGEVYVWGEMMAVPHHDQFGTLNLAIPSQYSPRKLKDNMIFYKVIKLFSGPTSSACLTEKGELLLGGLNESS